MFKKNKESKSYYKVFCTQCGMEQMVSGNHRKMLSACCKAPLTINEKEVFSNWVRLENEFNKNIEEEYIFEQ